MASKTMVCTPSTNGMPRPGLGRQGSNIFSLTLEEFQNEHGKIGSMNMEEFLKNVWTAEESQAMVSAMAGGEAGAGVSQNTLQRQASLCNVPPSLGDKTVEEVWKEIQAQKQQQQQQQRQQQEVSFGEMTLEDFLVRAGVVKEDMDAVPGTLGPQGNLEMPQQQAEWINYQMKQQQLLQQQAEAAAYVKRPSVANLILPTGPAGGAYFDGAYDGGALTPASLALSPGIGTPDTPSKKRNIDLVVEKTVERRQRRMIKNRESAARSRARKQAYTVELETEVQQLKEENARLKRWQAGEAERRRKQIMEVFLPVTQQQQQQQQQHQQRRRRDLRRTRSFP